MEDSTPSFETQMSFRPQKNCRDASYFMQQAIKDILQTEKGFNLLYVDFSQACPWTKLSTRTLCGISTKYGRNHQEETFKKKQNLMIIGDAYAKKKRRSNLRQI